VSFEQPIRPFHINRVLAAELEGLRDIRIEIGGRTLDGREIELFSAFEQSAIGELPCYFYVDDSVQAVRLEISSSTSETAAFEVPVRINPYRVTVSIASGRLPNRLRGYRFNTNEQQLAPGDVLVLAGESAQVIPEEDLGKLLSRGIHVITTFGLPGLGMQITAENPWQGELIVLDFLNTAVLTEVLDGQRENFAAFKKRYYDLVAAAQFYGIAAPLGENLTFMNARLEDIVASLERESLPARISGYHRVVLLGFTLAAVIFLVFLRRTAVMVSCLAVALCLFILLTMLRPEPEKSLELSFNLAHLESQNIELARTAATGEVSEGTAPGFLRPRIDTRSFAPTDFVDGQWSLDFRLTRSPEREIPLSAFTQALNLKFDQYPLIERRQGRYIVKYVNPLRYWSLHEPE
jgi:hypothetical protein